MTIEELLENARTRIAVEPEELDEAKRRRALVADALRAAFPGARIYFNGSLAHGDANDPLTDFDIGVIIPDPSGEYGPGGKSADELKARVRTAVRDALVGEFPNLRVEVEGRKRSVLIRFSDPVTDRADDFTGDVIVALDHPDAGLWIPRFSEWDRSHPEEHTRLVLAAIEATMVVFARVVRLLKHWNARHGDPLCSWHIKVLALDAIVGPQSLADALDAFFSSAADSLRAGPTPDPAGVGPDIKPRGTTGEAISRLDDALTQLRAAVTAEESNRPLRAQLELSKLLPEIVDEPDADDLADEDRAHEIGRLSSGVSTGVGAGAGLLLPSNRGWSCDD